MAESTELIKKLQVKSGAKLWLVNVPEPFAMALTAGAEVETVKAGEPFDGAIAFCENPTEVASFASHILPKLPPDGLLWFAYRKGDAAKKSGLSRDTGWEPVFAAGYTTVRSISFDETWTGLRFREMARVKTKA
jgi:hypothetical protein